MIATVLGRQSWRTWADAFVSVVAIIVASVGAASVGVPAMWPRLVLAGTVAILAQAAALRLRQGNGMVYLGWGEAALIIVAYLVPAGWVPLTIGVGALVGQFMYRLRTGTPLSWRVLSNTRNLALAATAGTLVAHAVTDGPIIAVTARSITGLVAGALAYCLVSVSFVHVAFAGSVSEFLRADGRALLSKTPMVIGNVTIGVTFIAVFSTDTRWLLIMPAVLVLTYQAYVFRTRASDERRIWREFAEIARSLNQLDERSVATAAVTGIQKLFVAAAVEIWVDRLGGSARGYRGVPMLSGVEVVELAGRPVEHPAAPNAVRALSIGGVRVGEVRVWMAPGSTLELRDHMAMSAVCEAIAAALHDASAHRALQALAARSFYAAHHDVLTGLPNRATLVCDGAVAVGALPATDTVALLLLGINRFKEVNDTLGHLAGDDLLRVTATRLAAFVGAGDVVARLAGDKFALLATRLGASLPVESALARAHDLAEQLAVPTEVAGLHLAVEVSVGVATATAGECDIDELLRRADIAMYRAKRGAGVVTAYGSDQADAIVGNRDRLSIVLDLREAMEHDNQLVLDVLPALDLATGAPISVETLVRWHHPRRGLLAPSEFVDIVDASDLVATFTRYVLDRSLRLADAWATAGVRLPVSVNLSPRSLADATLPADVEALLKLHGIAPNMLVLEITEAAVVGGRAVVDEVLSALRTLGVQLAVDDFGTGYSSLTFLTKVQVDEVKVDSSFVASMVSSPEAAAIVRTTIDLGHRLGVRVVAEGVETAAQRSALQELGCRTAQGRHLVPPVDAHCAIDLLRELIATSGPNRLFPLYGPG
jgi:diguanylate cyclase (GGDEF)-like protein